MTYTNKRTRSERDEDDLDDLFNKPQGYFERTHVANTITVYFDEPIEEPAKYRQVLHKIHSLGRDDTVECIVNTPGGRFDSTVSIINALKSTEADVIGILDNEACSAGSLILLACPNIVVMPNSRMMIHNYSAGFGGKGHELASRMSFNDAETQKLMAEVYLGFLTDKELGQVFAGTDFWFNSDEVIARLKQRAKFLDKLQKKVESEQRLQSNPKRKPKPKLESLTPTAE
jgi:ATP-dependent protease ClpP protease subunit